MAGSACRGERGWRMQRIVLVAEPRPRQLTVVGGSFARGRLVVTARLLLVAQRLGGASLPIACAGIGGGIAGALRHLGEMRHRGRRIIEEAQRNPAGGEWRLPAMALLVRYRGIAGDPIGSAGIAKVEQLAGQHTALDPP